MKKGIELSHLCAKKVIVAIWDEDTKKLIEFSSSSDFRPEHIQSYRDKSKTHEVVKNEDYEKLRDTYNSNLQVETTRISNENTEDEIISSSPDVKSIEKEEDTQSEAKWCKISRPQIEPNSSEQEEIRSQFFAYKRDNLNIDSFNSDYNRYDELSPLNLSLK